jgi:hypothetical protein
MPLTAYSVTKPALSGLPRPCHVPNLRCLVAAGDGPGHAPRPMPVWSLLVLAAAVVQVVLSAMVQGMRAK